MLKRIVVNRIIWISTLVIFIGCSYQQIETSKVTINPKDATKMQLSEIIDTIRLTFLETNDASLIRKAVQLKKKDGQFYINDSRNKLLIFDKLGHLISSSANRLGSGPEEYSTLLGFDIIPDSMIELFDALSYKMIVYDKSMNYVSEFSLPKEILPAEDYIRVTNDLYLFFGGEKTKLDLKIYSKSKNKIIKRIERNAVRKEIDFVQVTPHSLHIYDGNYYFTETFPSNELYRFEAKTQELMLALQIDFGEYAFSMDQLTSSVKDPVSYFKEYSGRYAFTSAKYLLPDIDIVFFYFENKLYVAFNRKDQNQTSIYYNEPLSLQLPIPDLVQDSCFYYVCEPLYLPFYVDSCLMSKEDIAKMKSVKDDDNPIIIQYKLK